MSATQPECVIFGSIGALAHCSEIQWKTFNQALGEAVDAGKLKLSPLADDDDNNKIFWEKEPYRASLTSTGGKNRVKEYLLKQMVEEADKELVNDDLVKAIHTRKTELFLDYILQKSGAPGLTLRPGIMELLTDAKKAGVKTAFCSTSEKLIIDAFVQTLGLAELFDLVLSNDDLPKFGNKAKPAPDCYWFVVKTLFALNPLGLNKAPDGSDRQESGDTTTSAESMADMEEGKSVMKSRVIVAFEDTEISLKSPVSAEVALVVATPNNWAVEQDYSKAHKCTEVADLGGNALQALADLAGPVGSAHVKKISDGSQWLGRNADGGGGGYGAAPPSYGGGKGGSPYGGGKGGAKGGR